MLQLLIINAVEIDILKSIKVKLFKHSLLFIYAFRFIINNRNKMTIVLENTVLLC